MESYLERERHTQTYIYVYVYLCICIYIYTHSILFPYHGLSWDIPAYIIIHHHTSSYIIIHHCRITAMVGLTNTIIIQSLLVKPMAGSSRKAFNDVWTLNLDSFRWTELLCHGNPPAPRSGHVAFQKAGTFLGERAWAKIIIQIFFFSGIMGI